MDLVKTLILIHGQDKTAEIAYIKPEHDKYKVVFQRTPRTYCYSRESIQIFSLQKEYDPAYVVPVVGGKALPGVSRILDFGPYYRIMSEDRSGRVYPRKSVRLEEDCRKDQKISTLYDHFKATAAAVGLKAEDGRNILSIQYDHIQRIHPRSVLTRYLDPRKPPIKRTPPKTLIYPFGLNQSQKVAVENAFSSQVSIIQGPPGTGKTQTILNIVCNAVRDRQTVAVVSNNNSAILNVAEKLEKKELSFITAFLGSLANKERFLQAQTGKYPDMSHWALEPEEQQQLDLEVSQLSAELDRMLDMKNRIAAIEQELLQLCPEEHYFSQYYTRYQQDVGDLLKGLTSQKLLALWAEYEDQMEQGNAPGILKSLSILFRYNFSALRIFRKAPERIIPYLQKQFYLVRRQELERERDDLQQQLTGYAFEAKTQELTEKSLRLFRCELSQRFSWKDSRMRFTQQDLRQSSDLFNTEYPVILSTTYAIKGTLDFDHLYDLLIIDEASQVDLATGVLALASARNIVIVGDLKQLPNVLDPQDAHAAERIWELHPFDEAYHYTRHSLLSSACAVWRDAPSVLLREHYRCHPKIINFCNQKFYDGQLIIMTEDRQEKDALTLFCTVQGNHARGHHNQRQIDVIREEVLPRLRQQGYSDIGIIAPYRDQVDAIRQQLGEGFDVDTVHKFQGREKEAIILTSVDNVIGDFVDDPHMLNVAVSRASRALAVVTSQDPRNDRTNYGDLARYIAYNNYEIIDSRIYSVFDLLYQSYAPERSAYLKKKDRVSEHDSEELLYSVIEPLLGQAEFSQLRCALHVSLSTLVKDMQILTEEEQRYAGDPLTHTDFLFYRRLDKTPVLAVELDGTSFHRPGSRQALRDDKKNSIFQKCGIPLLRIRTDESGEARKISEALLHALDRPEENLT